MKICVLGGGTAAAVCVLELHRLLKSPVPRDIQIYSVYDPTIPTTLVGESASLLVLQLLQDVLDFDPADDLKDLDGTIRWCTKYFWQDANNKDFKVTYRLPGMHMNSEKFSQYVLNKIQNKYSNHRIIHSHVLEITQSDKSVIVKCEDQLLEFDYVIDCTGSPSKEDLEGNKYSRPEFVGVNSVILFPHVKEYNENFTSSYIHKNGWMFGVPLTFRKAYGYLYNNSITSEQEAITEFSAIKGIDASTCRKFSWDQYYRKNAIDHRVLYMGNKIYFFEPHQAIPLHYYILLTRKFFESVLLNYSTSIVNSIVNQHHLANMSAIQDLIALNYQGENKINSEFWNYAKASSFNRLNNSPEFKNWAALVDRFGWRKYWSHDDTVMKQYCEGFDINLKQFIK
jgi:hypothetical protein